MAPHVSKLHVTWHAIDPVTRACMSAYIIPLSREDFRGPFVAIARNHPATVG